MVPEKPLVTARVLKWDDGSETRVHALERPFILLDKNGRPSHLFAACSVENEFAGSTQTPRRAPTPIKPQNLPFNVCIPLVPPRG